MQPRHDGAYGHAQNLGSLGIAKLLETDQQNHFFLLARQAVDGIAQGSDRKVILLRRACRRLKTGTVQRTHWRCAIVAPARVDADVVHDRKEPAPNVAPAPEMSTAPGPFQAILNKVVCALPIAH